MLKNEKNPTTPVIEAFWQASAWLSIWFSPLCRPIPTLYTLYQDHFPILNTDLRDMDEVLLNYVPHKNNPISFSDPLLSPKLFFWKSQHHECLSSGTSRKLRKQSNTKWFHGSDLIYKTVACQINGLFWDPPYLLSTYSFCWSWWRGDHIKWTYQPTTKPDCQQYIFI